MEIEYSLSAAAHPPKLHETDIDQTMVIWVLLAVEADLSRWTAVSTALHKSLLHMAIMPGVGPKRLEHKDCASNILWSGEARIKLKSCNSTCCVWRDAGASY